MIAELLVVFAISLAEMGDALKGARLLGAAVAASEAVGESLSDEDAGRIAAARRHLRAALGEEQWADAFAEGTGLSLEEALAVLPSEGD
jgi:cytochrome c553